MSRARRLTRMWLVLTVIGLSFSCGSKQESPVVHVRPLDSVFSRVREITVASVKPGNVVAMATDSSGQIYIIDSKAHSVDKFDAMGNLVGSLGGYGWSPGNFISPWTVTCDSQNRVYVTDIKTGRLSIFDDSGKLLDTQMLSTLGIIGISLNVNPHGEIYVGGLPINSTLSMPLLIHRLGADGNLVANFYPRDARIAKLNLTLVGGVNFDIDSHTGQLYATQPVSNEVHVFSPDGLEMSHFTADPVNYEPAIRFPRQLPSDKAQINRLLSRWTELTDLRIVPQKRVLLVFNIHSPVAYDLELYTEDGSRVVGGIGTPLHLAYVDQNANAYFYDQAGDTLKLAEFSLSRLKTGGTS